MQGGGAPGGVSGGSGKHPPSDPLGQMAASSALASRAGVTWTPALGALEAVWG